MTFSAFSPDRAWPPGASIEDALIAKGFSIEDFCAEIGLSSAAASDLLRGEMIIDDPLAGRLSQTLGASTRFWLKREAQYRTRLQRLSSSGVAEAERSFLTQLPLRDMKAYGWLQSYGHLSQDDAALAFFEDERGDWRDNGLGLMNAVAFRTSYAHATNPAAVAAWLRQGELQAAKLDPPPWNADSLRSAIPQLRALTRVKEPAKFFPKLVEICRSCGVAVVFVRTPKGCRASGATHFASPERAIIQLSFRYRSDDHFWFTFFHEVAHLLLHGNSALFVEGSDYIATDEEEEANAFSAKTLVPPEFEHELSTLGRKFSVIMRFAKRIGVSPGVVVGQMQKRGILRHEQMNFLKVHYDWAEMEGINP